MPPFHYLGADRYSTTHAMLNTDTYRTPRRRPPSRFFPLEAEELLRSGQVENATELCKRGLIYFPDNISGYAVLAQAYLLLGHEERAVNVLEDGYRRTGAEGLNRLRLMMEGESLERLLEPTTDVVLPAQEEELESPVSGTVETDEANEEAEAEPSSEVAIEAEESAQPIETGVAPETEVDEIESTEQNEADTLSEVGIDMAESEEPVEADAPLAESIHSEEEATLHEASAIVENIEPSPDESMPVEVESQKEVEIEDPLAIEGSEEPESVEAEREAGLHTEVPTESISEPASLPSIESGEEEPDAGIPSSHVPTPVREEIAASKKDDVSPGTETREPGRAKEKKIGHGGLSLHSGTKISRLSSSNLRLIPGLEFAPLRRDDEPKIRIASLINELPAEFSLSFDPIIPGLATPSADTSASTSTEVPTAGSETESFVETAPVSATLLSHENVETETAEVEAHQAIDEERIDEADLFPEIQPIDHTEERSHSGMTPLEELARRLETARIPIVEEEEGTYHRPAFEPSIVSDTFASILVGQGAYAEAVKAYQTLARMKPERREEYERKIADVRRMMEEDE